MPICMAKTQYSFSDDPTLFGAPTGFNITVREVKVNAGAGFIVALTGAIMTMPGLPKVRLRMEWILQKVERLSDSHKRGVDNMGIRLAGKPVVESLRENILSRVDKLNENLLLQPFY